MAAITAVRCTVCGASTSLRPDAVRQKCDFCGAEFIFEATHQAAGAVERNVNARLAAIQPHLDALAADAKARSAAGDFEGAKYRVGEIAHAMSAIYRETGHYRLMGVETEADIQRMLGFSYGLEMARLGIRDPNAPVVIVLRAPPGQDRMTAGLTNRNFDDAYGGFYEFTRTQLERDPRFAHLPPEEREQWLATTMRSFALGLPWATDAEFARYGIEVVRVSRRPDGSASVTCVRCGGEVMLAQLTENATCGHCSATFRIRLEGVDLYHARGHTDVTAADVAHHNAALSTDVPTRIALGKKTVDGMNLKDQTRAKELTFFYGVQMGVPMSAEAQMQMAAQLGLGAPRACKSCSQTIAIAPATKACPMCTAKKF